MCRDLRLQLLRFRVYSFQNARLFAFELLVAVEVFFGKVHGELKMSAMDASKGPDAAGADAEQALPNRRIVELEIDLRTV